MIDLPYLIEHCVPPLAKTSMSAIVKVESKGNPLALNLNKGYKLQFQPQTKAQALKWTEFLEKHGYNFDIGLAQVNIKNANKYGYKVSELLDSCTNLKLGSTILINNYTNALPVSKSVDQAWQKAISAYNTGNFYSGFTNGYVSKVYASANKPLLALSDNNSDIPPIIDNHVRNNKTKVNVPALSNSGISLNPYSSRSLLYIQQRKPIPQEISNIKVKDGNSPAT